MTVTLVEQTTPLDRLETIGLAAADERLLEILSGFDKLACRGATDCSLWDIRPLAAHVLGGMEVFVTFPEFVHQMRTWMDAVDDAPFINGMTAVQVSGRVSLTRSDLLASLGPRV